MPTFNYKAKSGDGRVIKGSARAVDLRDLGAQLSTQGLFLIDADEVTGKTSGLSAALPGTDNSGGAHALEVPRTRRGRSAPPRSGAGPRFHLDRGTRWPAG